MHKTLAGAIQAGFDQALDQALAKTMGPTAPGTILLREVAGAAKGLPLEATCAVLAKVNADLEATRVALGLPPNPKGPASSPTRQAIEKL